MQEKKKRIFIAVNLPPQIKKNIKQKCLSVCLKYFKEDTSIKWVVYNNLHITLKFLGYIRSNEILKVEEILRKKIVDMQPLNLGIRNFGYFPEKGIPSVLWLTALSQDSALQKLAYLLEELLVMNGFRKEIYKEFIPHITLGRIKKPLNREEKENLNIIKAELEAKIIGRFKLKSIDIMESKLSKNGPMYSLIKKIELK